MSLSGAPSSARLKYCRPFFLLEVNEVFAGCDVSHAEALAHQTEVSTPEHDSNRAGRRALITIDCHEFTPTCVVKTNSVHESFTARADNQKRVARPSLLLEDLSPPPSPHGDPYSYPYAHPVQPDHVMTHVGDGRGASAGGTCVRIKDEHNCRPFGNAHTHAHTHTCPPYKARHHAHGSDFIFDTRLCSISISCARSAA